MKKDSKRNIINLVFSSFLVIGYIVCSYFFYSLSQKVAGVGGNLIQLAILLVFGLLLFYATRVGEGRQVKRFSLPVLLLLDIPCIYIALAAMIKALPLHEQLAPVDGAFPVILILAIIALGYGIPYTFLSGYELDGYPDEQEDQPAEENAEAEKDAEAESEDEAEPVEGGLAEEIAEAEAADETDDSEDKNAAQDEPAEEE